MQFLVVVDAGGRSLRASAAAEQGTKQGSRDCCEP